MSLKRQYVYVIAICLSVIVAGAIIAYNPFQEKEADNVFKFPAGVPPSLGIGYATSLGEGDVNSIQVSGLGSVSATATQATLTLGAWTEDPVAAEAVEDNALLMTSIIDAVLGLGIEEDKIKTVTYSVSTIYDWEIRAVTGYRVTNMIQIEVEDIDMVGEVIDAAAAEGANNIQGISFGVSDEEAEALANDAYVLALQNAQGKADLSTLLPNQELRGGIDGQRIRRAHPHHRGDTERLGQRTGGFQLPVDRDKPYPFLFFK
jgi:hypothetical protein